LTASALDDYAAPMRRALLVLLLLSLAPPANAAEGEGSVMISLRSQQVFRESLRVYFLRDGGSEADPRDLLMVERVQRFARPSMLLSLKREYRLKSGHWRLLAHLVGCEGLPPPGQVCTRPAKGGAAPLPTRRYGADAPGFTIEAGKTTDAGEFVLEYPKGSTAMTFIDDPARATIRWRQPQPATAEAINSLLNVPALDVPDAFRSAIHCDTLQAGYLEPAYLPFDC
jgi:hypothetical protein